MSEPRAGASYWMKSAEAPAYPELAEDVTVEVAVIGAGIAGLSIAWELSRQGREVAVVEAAQVAAGVSGHTTAKVSSLHGACYGRLTSRLGPDTAAAYATSQQLAVRHVAEVSELLGIDCDLESRPAYLYTESGDTGPIEAEARAAARAGLPAAFTTDTGLPFGVSGAVRVDEQLMFHPRKYLLGLAADLTARGGRIYERTRVTELDEGQPSTLTTAGGHRITATDVVVATHYPIFDRALLFARLTPRREFAVTSIVAESNDPPGMYISDAQDIRSVRSTPYGDGRRLLIATGAPFTPGDASAAEHVDGLTSWMRDRFGVSEVVHTWAAQDNHSSDGVPFIGPLHPLAKHTWVATGFGGWGMTSGVLSGILLAELIAGREPDYAAIYRPRRFHPTVEAKSLLKAQATVASHWAGSRLRARLPGAAGIQEIQAGQAGLISDGDGHWATYVDEAGQAHQVSATCTHMGCLVAFNQVEREWECPCHGSRFGLDGAVLQGPATQPLKPRPPSS